MQSAANRTEVGRGDNNEVPKRQEGGDTQTRAFLSFPEIKSLN